MRNISISKSMLCKSLNLRACLTQWVQLLNGSLISLYLQATVIQKTSCTVNSVSGFRYTVVLYNVNGYYECHHVVGCVTLTDNAYYLCVKAANMCHVLSSSISSLARWIQSDQDLLDKSSGQTTSSSVCTLVYATVA